jgi:hypothetical protein
VGDPPGAEVEEGGVDVGEGGVDVGEGGVDVGEGAVDVGEGVVAGGGAWPGRKKPQASPVFALRPLLPTCGGR